MLSSRTRVRAYIPRKAFGEARVSPPLSLCSSVHHPRFDGPFGLLALPLSGFVCLIMNLFAWHRC